MKKFVAIFASFLFAVGFSQEKKIEFSKELKYESFAEKGNNGMRPAFNLVGNTNGEFLTTVEMNTFPISIFSDQLGMTPVKIELNNKLSGSLFANYFLGFSDGSSVKKNSEVIVKNLNSTENILGFPCNNYLLTYSYGGDEYEDSENTQKENLKICVDEKNSMDNFSVLSGILNQVSRVKISIPNVKGLILKVGPEKSYDKDFIVLKSMKDAKNFVYFDHQKAMMQQQKTMDSLMTARSKYENDYGELDSLDYSMDSTAVVVDSAYAGYDDEFDFEKYESTYKKKPEEITYAIDNLFNAKMWNMLPKHCKNIDENLPTLQNKEFRNHLKNFTGQMCDLYLLQSDYHNVAIKITIDDVRREFLFINENKEKLNKSDQKKVNQYLENLD